jgi:hypothetical protein
VGANDALAAETREEK